MSYPKIRYRDKRGEINASRRPASTAANLAIGSTTQVHYLSTGATTDGHYGLYRWEMGSDPSGPAPHFHRTISESFYVLSGTVQLYEGREWSEARAGDFLYVPPGGVHAFANRSGEPASMLLLFAPGAPREAYFEELAEIARTGRRLSDEEWTELYQRHDQYMV
ncbi:MAG: cupin domain-containing protein [Mycobacterium sp.]|nr:cupin domain-containing protein [Mycobacterium sp.]